MSRFTVRALKLTNPGESSCWEIGFETNAQANDNSKYNYPFLLFRSSFRSKENF